MGRTGCFILKPLARKRCSRKRSVSSAKVTFSQQTSTTTIKDGPWLAPGHSWGRSENHRAQRHPGGIPDYWRALIYRIFTSRLQATPATPDGLWRRLRVRDRAAMGPRRRRPERISKRHALAGQPSLPRFRGRPQRKPNRNPGKSKTHHCQRIRKVVITCAVTWPAIHTPPSMVARILPVTRAGDRRLPRSRRRKPAPRSCICTRGVDPEKPEKPGPIPGSLSRPFPQSDQAALELRG